MWIFIFPLSQTFSHPPPSPRDYENRTMASADPEKTGLGQALSDSARLVLIAAKARDVDLSEIAGDKMLAWISKVSSAPDARIFIRVML